MRIWILFALLLLVGAAPAAAEDHSDANHAVYRLLGQHLASSDDAVVAQAVKLAKATGNEGLIAFATSWAGLDPATRKRYQRIRAASHSAQALTKQRKVVEAKATFDGVREDLRKAPANPFSTEAAFVEARITFIARDLPGALRFLHSALDQAITLQWAVKIRECREMIDRLCEMVGDYAPLFSAIKKTRTYYESREDTTGLVSTHLTEASAHARTGDRKAAEKSVRNATALAIDVGSSRLMASAHVTHGAVLSAFGAKREAAHASLQAAAAFRDVKEWSGVLTAVSNAILFLGDAGRYAEALEHYERVRTELAHIQPPELLLDLHLNAGGIYLHLGLRDEAIVVEQEALRLAILKKDPRSIMRARGNITIAHIQLKRYDEAIKSLTKILTPNHVLEYAADAAISYVARASCYRRTDRFDEAEADLERARALATKLQDRHVEGMLLEEAAELAIKQKQPEAALRHFRHSLKLAHTTGQAGYSLAFAHDGAARALTNLGRFDEALRAAESAMEIFEAIGMTLADREGVQFRKAANQAGHTGIAAAFAWGAGDKSKVNEAAARAWTLSEAGRGRSLVSAIADPESLLRSTLPPELRTVDRESRQAIRDARDQLLAAIHHRKTDEIKRARAALDTAWKRRREAIASMQRRAKRIVDLVYPQPVALSTIQSHLDSCCALISYHILLQDVFAFVVTKESLLLIRLGDAEGLEDQISQYLRLVSSPGSKEQELAHTLHQSLIHPFERSLEGKTRLVIVTDGDLCFLPFSALVHTRKPKPVRLIERFEIVLAPSASAYDALLTQAKDKPGTGLVAVGDPTYVKGGPFDPLPGSRREVAAVAKHFAAKERTVLLGDDATPELLQRALTKAKHHLRAVHLACHARIDPHRARLSGLVLSGGAMFDLDTVMRTRISADLAVLSACDSARGKVLPGSGTQGFVRGFLLAGTPRVVVSNWRVADASTKDLMASFYDEMIKNKRTAAAALRRAKLKTLRAGGAKAHPYYWAPFVLWGLPN